MSSKKVIEIESLPLNIRKGGVYYIEQSNPNNYTHGMFKYPCKFIPEIPRWAIKKYLSKIDSCVLDPFAGSGTTLLEANINGYDCFGTEIDDVCKLITKVKTTKLSKNKIKSLDSINESIVDNVSKKIVCSKPNINNIEHWFSSEAIDQLSKMIYTINKIEDKDVKDFFKLCFVSIIKKVSNADDISPKPYVSSKIVKKSHSVISEWNNTYIKYKKMILDLNDIKHFGKSRMIKGDALNFKTNREIDLAITSPPYINAFDYGRALRLENLWLDLLTEDELVAKKKRYVGTEKINIKAEENDLSILNKSRLLKKYYSKIYKVDKKRALILKKFFDDIYRNLLIVNECLVSNGKYVIVIGNSNIRKTTIESWKVISEISNYCGFKIDTYFSYIIRNKYIRIPRNGVGGKINEDYVLVLSKENRDGSRK